MMHQMMATNKRTAAAMAAAEDDGDDSSDFDDDDDPDKTEVPGGGRDLAAAVATTSSVPHGSIVRNSLPGGLVTKGNSLPGYELVPGGNGSGGGRGRTVVNSASSMPSSGAMINTSHLLHQMELASMGLGGVNPFLVQNLGQLLSGNGGGSAGMGAPGGSWGASARAVSSLWMTQADAGRVAVAAAAAAAASSTSMSLSASGQQQQHAMVAAAAAAAADQDEVDADEEQLGVAETYADYMPSKLRLGRKHPDPVVETASLSSVPPADVWYEVALPKESVQSGALSALQLESVTYACQQHEHLSTDGTRAGFLIGDGAGVGKGRTIAAIIFENYLRGRKRALWVSVSNDLRYDAERDLRDIGATKIPVHALSKFKYAKISSAANGSVRKGVVFCTYSALIGESSGGGDTTGDGANSATKYRSRLKQLLQWCGGEQFDGPVVFDECHRAKNLCPAGSGRPTKTGLTVLELQRRLPKARVVYASATGASEPRNMAYMVRLGMWGAGTPFADFGDFISAVERRGVGAMEVVAMDMKLRGTYIARQLSFHGVSFRVEEVGLDAEFVRMYDDAVRLWTDAMRMFGRAADLLDAEGRMRKTMWGQFWSAHQRFFKYLCIAAKVGHAVTVAREAVKCGKCVVIGLQSTGEARTLEQLERDDGELSDFVSTAKGVLQSLVERHFPAPDRGRVRRLLAMAGGGGSAGGSSANKLSASKKRKASGTANKTAAQQRKKRRRSSDSSDSDAGDDALTMASSGSDWDRSEEEEDDLRLNTSATSRSGSGGGGAGGGNGPAQDNVDRACTMKRELLRRIEQLGERLPPNTLDQLIDELGGPENVAEMTGRRGRVVQTEDGGVQYESRTEGGDVPLETLNLTEKRRFMDGEKDVAIISEAASSGISLQSDRRVRNQRRRVHITLELPWSADRAVQQFGRTHRSNQVNAPEYVFLISDLAGERRFASTVARRLESLGALTHGDRRATDARDLSQFNIDTRYGRAALEATLKTVVGLEAPLVPPPSDYKGPGPGGGNFFRDVATALAGVGLVTLEGSGANTIPLLDKDYASMPKFLNRILGMPVDLQNRLFRYFTDTLGAIVAQAKRLGRYDLGILDVEAAGGSVRRVRLHTFVRRHATGTAPTELHVVHVERGMSWPRALDRWREARNLPPDHDPDEEVESGDEDGGGVQQASFYLSLQARNGKHTALLAVPVSASSTATSSGSSGGNASQQYTVYRPNTGLQVRQETGAELRRRYRRAKRARDARTAWHQQHEAAATVCSHAYWRGNCRAGPGCEVGLRRRTYNVLAGSVLGVWARVEAVLAARSHHNANKMQVVRLRTDDGVKIVGTLIPSVCVPDLVKALAADAQKTSETVF